MNPYLKRLHKHGTGKSGRASEHRTSKRLGLDQQPASGAMEGAKGDLRGLSFVVECKSTVNDSIAVTRTWLTKIKFEARDQNREPALAINFTTGDGQPQPYGSWVMIEEKTFKKIMELLDENDLSTEA